MPSANNEPITTEARSKAIFGSNGVAVNSRQSLSKMGLFRPRRFSLAANNRNAVIAAETRAILDLNHDFMLKQMVGSGLDVAKFLAPAAAGTAPPLPPQPAGAAAG